jgi:hypothetical protein
MLAREMSVDQPDLTHNLKWWRFPVNIWSTLEGPVLGGRGPIILGEKKMYFVLGINVFPAKKACVNGPCTWPDHGGGSAKSCEDNRHPRITGLRKSDLVLAVLTEDQVELDSGPAPAKVCQREIRDGLLPPLPLVRWVRLPGGNNGSVGDRFAQVGRADQPLFCPTFSYRRLTALGCCNPLGDCH